MKTSTTATLRHSGTGRALTVGQQPVAILGGAAPIARDDTVAWAGEVVAQVHEGALWLTCRAGYAVIEHRGRMCAQACVLPNESVRIGRNQFTASAPKPSASQQARARAANAGSVASTRGETATAAAPGAREQDDGGFLARPRMVGAYLLAVGALSFVEIHGEYFVHPLLRLVAPALVLLGLWLVAFGRRSARWWIAGVLSCGLTGLVGGVVLFAKDRMIEQSAPANVAACHAVEATTARFNGQLEVMLATRNAEVGIRSAREFVATLEGLDVPDPELAVAVEELGSHGRAAEGALGSFLRAVEASDIQAAHARWESLQAITVESGHTIAAIESTCNAWLNV